MSTTPVAGLDDPSALAAKRDEGGRQRGFTVAVLLTALALIGIACLLPHDRYVRFQSLRGTLHDRASWVYERLHFDPTPVDVVIVGSSRAAVGMDQVVLDHDLSAFRGAAVHVANLAFAQPGYDLSYVILREALETKKPRIALVGISEHGGRLGHPAFKDLADASDFLAAPPVVNWSYLPNLIYLPTRQVRLALDTSLWRFFGFARGFDPNGYPGPDIDLRHRFPVVLDPEEAARARGAETIDQASERYFRSGRQVHLPGFLADTEFAAERVYVRRMKALADAHDVKLMFIYMPFFKGTTEVLDLDFYGKLGTVLVPPADVTGVASNFMDPIHLNDTGSKLLSTWLAGQLGPDL